MSEETLGEQFKNPKPVHASQLPWNTVRQAGAIHVGTESQADSIAGSGKGWPITVNTRDKRLTFEAGEHDVHRLDWQPGVEFHPHLLSDAQANLAHYHHSEQHGYPRGRSVDDSLDGDPGPLHPGSVVGKAVQALNEGKVVAYNNVHEGGTTGSSTSHLVPDPHRMLRKRGEEPTAVQPTLFAAGQFAGGGPFRHATTASAQDIAYSRVPGQIGRGMGVKFEPHLAGAPHRPLTFDEKTQQSRSATVRSMTKKPEREPLIHPDWKRAQGTLF